MKSIVTKVQQETYLQKLLKWLKTNLTVTNCINECISWSTFQDELKIADISVYQKQYLNDKTKNQPISLLPFISKIFGKILYSQLETVANKVFSAKLCGFRKGHSSQNALLNFLKNWQKCLLTSRVVWTVSVDLNKANDCLSLDLLIVKLSAYGLTIRSLR